ncbi:unnamed protein product [Spodoptera littoralis]|uniref:Uncharacterized protein n=1 Tax=Spodoptera littoralis TaxID=7109 RepID=A0A9P0I806_SPOLI|nr:unnamed protein product [Spodoptera littoralis]CAH1641859.1 unnamed protein product [Spodoptera littoralis]
MEVKALQLSVTDMSACLLQRMASFEEELKKSPELGGNPSNGLSARFSAFRSFAIQAIYSLQQQVNILIQSSDTTEMRRRRKILLVHGVADSEAKEEDTAKVLVKVVREHLSIDLQPSDIKRCHRMGRTTRKARPILVKLHSVVLRDNIWHDKTKLKGTGITISEFLTKTRHSVFMSARDRFGVSQCWTRRGTVFVLDSRGIRHRVSTVDDLDKIEPQPDGSGVQQQTSGQSGQSGARPADTAAAKVVAPKGKRAAARK